MRTFRGWWVSSVAAAMLTGALGVGCYATASSAYEPGAPSPPDDFVYEDAPPQVETYPVVVYEGAPHYYVNGRWYRRTPRGWAYYRREPAHLAGRRPPPPRQVERREERREERHEDRRDERRDEHHDDRHDEHHEDHH